MKIICRDKKHSTSICQSVCGDAGADRQLAPPACRALCLGAADGWMCILCMRVDEWWVSRSGSWATILQKLVTAGVADVQLNKFDFRYRGRIWHMK